MAQNQKSSDQAVLHSIINGLYPLDPAARSRIIRTVLTYFELEQPGLAPTTDPLAHDKPKRIPSSNSLNFGGHQEVSAKEFMLEKLPRSDVERVACLAYYLTHYRDTPHFKTIDISKANTEAAQFKFSNTAKAVNNAASRGFLAPAGKGNKQLSALGEQFVAALPDRDASRQTMDRLAPRRRSKQTRVGKGRK